MQFLIQSDFVTQASREDVFDSAWNRRLVEEVKNAFLSSIDDNDGFLNHDDLRFRWVRYIPTEEIVDDFWRTLRMKIIDSLRHRRVFLPRLLSNSSLHR